MDPRTNRAPMSAEALESRWEADEAACWAHRRVHVYRLLSAGFGPPAPFLRRLLAAGEFPGYLRQALSADSSRFAPAVEGLVEFFRGDDPEGRAEEEHLRLFPRRVSPRGSDHGGPPTEETRAFYREAAMGAPLSPLPADHVAVETAFLAALAEREMGLARRGLPEEAGEPREVARRFLEVHVAPWVPGFARAVEAAGSPFYGPLARVLERWVELERV